MTGAQFPGHAYGVNAEPLTADAPALSDGVVEAYRFSGVVVAEEPIEDDTLDAGLIFALRDGSRFADIPPLWVSRAVQLLRQGGAVVLLANDAAAERDIRDGLLDRLLLLELPTAGMGRA